MATYSLMSDELGWDACFVADFERRLHRPVVVCPLVLYELSEATDPEELDFPA